MSALSPRRSPTYPEVERRRRRRGRLSRLLTAPIPAPGSDPWLRPVVRLARPRVLMPIGAVALAVAAWIGWSHRASPLTPQHRAEALCFALAQPPRFAPPMTVEPGAAMVRGRFTERTPAEEALRQAMRFEDDMVIRSRRLRVGDYDVAVLWLRIPGTGSHWLVAGWMEAADLALCSFRFAAEGTDLTPEQTLWGERLLRRILVADNFRSDRLPDVRLPGREGMPRSFGPGSG